MNHKCTYCNADLVISENTTQYQINHHRYVCRSCDRTYTREWRKANPEKARAQYIRRRSRQGKRPFSETKECTQFLGVHVAERVLSHVFKNVERMPMNNPGYDFICNRGKKIDVKSSCRGHRKKGADRWTFKIGKNRVASYFLCLAFDNRDDLNPEHIWLIPGEDINSLTTPCIAETTLDRWHEYELDISKVSMCCGVLKQGNKSDEAGVTGVA